METYRVSAHSLNELLQQIEFFQALIMNIHAGRPRPRVTWFLENSVIDDSYEVRPDGVVVNHLSFPNVGRQHLNARLICQASNTNLAPPASKVVILDINRKYLLHYYYYCVVCTSLSAPRVRIALIGYV